MNLREKALKKLAKLKALSECKTGNENETATAAATMARLMLEYQIEMWEIETAEGQEPVVNIGDEVFDPEGKFANYLPWKKTIIQGLCSAFGCRLYWTPLPHSKKRRYKIVGNPGNIANIRDIYLFAVREIDRLAHTCGYWAPADIRDWKSGAAFGVVARVCEEREQVKTEYKGSQALVWIDKEKEAIAKHYAALDLEIGKAESVRFKNDEAFKEGYKKGKTLTVRKKLEEKSPKGLTKGKQVV